MKKDPGVRQEDNIKMGLREVGLGGGGVGWDRILFG